MCVDHNDTISTCMLDLVFVEQVQLKKNLVTTCVAHYDIVTANASIKKCHVTI